MKNQTITLGDFELTAISDGTYVSDGGAFFGIIPKIMWQRKVPADEFKPHRGELQFRARPHRQADCAD